MKKPDLATLAMYVLGGDEKALHIEDIAMKCEEIAPGTFAWKKYENQINLELVGFAVRDAKKEKYGGFITGSHAKGWRLTIEGIMHGKKLAKGYSKENKIVIKNKSRNPETTRNDKEMSRVRNSDAYKEWQKEKTVSKASLSKLLRINVYRSTETVDLKIATKLAQY